MNPSTYGGVKDLMKMPRLTTAAVFAVAPIVLVFACNSEKDPAATTAVAPVQPAPAEQKAPSPEYFQQLESARSLLAANKAQESLAPLERCKQEQPEAFAVHNNYCVAYGMLARKDEAVAACEHALKIEPNNQLAKNNLAWVSSIKTASAVQ